MAENSLKSQTFWVVKLVGTAGEANSGLPLLSNNHKNVHLRPRGGGRVRLGSRQIISHDEGVWAFLAVFGPLWLLSPL